MEAAPGQLLSRCTVHRLCIAFGLSFNILGAIFATAPRTFLLSLVLFVLAKESLSVGFHSTLVCLQRNGGL